MKIYGFGTEDQLVLGLREPQIVQLIDSHGLEYVDRILYQEFYALAHLVMPKL